jgi:general secretion pathway protein N
MAPRIRRLLASSGVMAMAVVMTLVLATGDETPSLPTAGVMPSVRAIAGNKVLPPATAFAAVVQRPLFLPNRKPEPEIAPSPIVAEVPAQPAAPLPLSATLVGVLMSPDGSSAILRLEDGKTATLREGGIIQGWTLKQIAPDRVSFLLGSTNLDLAFPTRQASPTAGSTPAQSVAAVRRRR